MHLPSTEHAYHYQTTCYSPKWAQQVHKARLQALQRHPGTTIDGDVAKVPYRVAVEMIQQMLAHFRPHRFSAMYDMSHCTKSTVAIGYHFHDVDERQKALLGNDRF